MPHSEPHRDETTSAAPWISPGLVANGETVLRTIFDPHHLDLQSGALSNAAISLDDLRSRGWSVDRKRYTSLWRLKLDHRRWRDRKADLHQCYVIPISVGTLRANCRVEQGQTFSVTDYALWSNPAHATILLSQQGGDGMARKARTALMSFLPPYAEASTAFSTGDNWGWTRGMICAFLQILKKIFRLT